MQQFLRTGNIEGLDEKLQTIVELIKNNKNESALEHLDEYIHQNDIHSDSDEAKVIELISLLINISYSHDYTKQYPELHKLVKLDNGYTYVINHLCFYYKNGLDYSNFLDLGGNKVFQKPLYQVEEVKEFINEIDNVEGVDDYFKEIEANDEDDKTEAKFYYESQTILLIWTFVVGQTWRWIV